MPYPAPVYRSRVAKLYCGEAVELLSRRALDRRAELADVITIDPPYNSGGIFPTGRVCDPVLKYAHNADAKGRATFTGDCRDQRSFQFWLWRVLELCRVNTKDKGYLLCFTDWRQLPTVTDCIQAAGWTWRGIIPWDKGRGARAPHKGFARHQAEYVVWATNGAVPQLTDRGPFEGVLRCPVTTKDKQHLTGKPTRIMEALAEFAPVGGLILDPTAGSATTGVGALLQARRFEGIELSLDYARIGAKRLRQVETGQAAA